jgi:shikimate kinase
LSTTQFGSKKKISIQTEDEDDITETNDDDNTNTLHTSTKKTIEITRCESSLCDTVEANVHAMLRIFTMIPETVGVGSSSSSATNVNCILKDFSFDSTLSNYLGKQCHATAPRQRCAVVSHIFLTFYFYFM